MNNIDKKVQEFGAGKGEKKVTEKQVVSDRDGLFESHEIVNRKLVSRDGRQLLREQNFEENNG